MSKMLRCVCLMQLACSFLIFMLLCNQLIMVCCGLEWTVDFHVIAFPAFWLVELLSEVLGIILMGTFYFKYGAIVAMMKGLQGR